VGSPLNDAQVLTGVFKPTTELVMKVVGDQITVEAHNSGDAETLALEGTITPNDFGGAGADWYGTVSRGNSNVYSRFEISYPGVATESCSAPSASGPEPASGSGSTPGATVGSAPVSKPQSTSSDGCAVVGPRQSERSALGALVLVGLFATRRSQRARRGPGHR
jgi:hypothetical protein